MRTLLVLLMVALCLAPSLCRADGPIHLLQAVEKGQVGSHRVQTWRKDGRKPVEDLYRAHLSLRDRHGWILEEVFQERVPASDSSPAFVLTAPCLRTPTRGPALWIITGIHGEEPAGPNAVAERTAILAALGRQGVPVVLLPLCNPLGYVKNWRYPNAERYSKQQPGHSVGDSDHLLPDERGNPRAPRPSSPECAALTAKVLELSRDYPPLLSLDLHEDDELSRGYLYSQGRAGAQDAVAREIIRIFRRNRFPVELDGETRFGEKLVGGIIAGVHDGSIDELIGAPKILVQGVSRQGPAAPSAIVLETGSKGTTLRGRVKVHAVVLEEAHALWRVAQQAPRS